MVLRRSGSNVSTKDNGQQQRAMSGVWMTCNIYIRYLVGDNYHNDFTSPALAFTNVFARPRRSLRYRFMWNI